MSHNMSEPEACCLCVMCGMCVFVLVNDGTGVLSLSEGNHRTHIIDNMVRLWMWVSVCDVHFAVSSNLEIVSSNTIQVKCSALQ